jgi:hypothetical protein
MPIELIIGAWVATGLTLFIFTFLYKDNPLFKLAENLYVGVSVGYTIIKTYDTVVVQLIWRRSCSRAMSRKPPGSRATHLPSLWASGQGSLSHEPSRPLF